IHSKASLYEAFPAVEARRLVERFEWHYTPKHGSWLNLAESELGVLTSQCLDRRIPNKQILIDEIAAWEHDRNANNTKADWQFTTKNALLLTPNRYGPTNIRAIKMKNTAAINSIGTANCAMSGLRYSVPKKTSCVIIQDISPGD